MIPAELVPTAAVVAAVGVLLLLVAPQGLVRIGGMALLVAGAAPVAVHLQPQVEHAIRTRPVLAAAGALGGVAAVLLLALLTLDRPWLIPVGAVAVGWLRVPIGSGADEKNLLLPLYGVIAAGLLAEAIRTLRRRGLPARLGPLGWAIGAYVVLVAASLFWTADLDRGATDVIAFYLPFGALAALLGGIDLRGRVPGAMATIQLALGVAFAGVALYQWQTREIFTNAKLIYVNAFADFFRVNSVFFDPSIYGRFCVLALVLAVAVLALGPPSRLALAAALAAPPAFAGLWLSYSQTSFVALAAALVALGLAAWGRRVALLAAGAAVLLVGLALALPQSRSVLSENLDKATSSRSDLAERGAHVFREHPVFGAGIGAFGTAAGTTGKERRQLRSHTAPVAVASELGAVGLAGLLAICVALVAALRRPAPDPATRRLRLILAVLLLAIGVHSLAYNALFEDPATWALAAWLALLSPPVRRTPEPAPAVEEPAAAPEPEPAPAPDAATAD